MIPIHLFTLLSKNTYEFPPNKEHIARISSPLGEGSYGKVFELNNKYAIKIFKNSMIGKVDMSGEEKSLIPEENENRELLFYFQLLQRNQELFTCSYKYVVQPIAIGITRETLLFPRSYGSVIDSSSGSKEKEAKSLGTSVDPPDSLRILANSYFVILPLCIPFYKALPIYNQQLIHLKKPTSIFETYQNYHRLPLASVTSSSPVSTVGDPHPFGIAFTLDIMQKMCIASIYLEEEFKIFNLDFKLQNVMFLKSSDPKIPFEDLIVIDFSLIKYLDTKEQAERTFHYDDLIDQKYFIWPYSGTTLVSNVPSYSICINGIELLYGKKQIEHLPSYKTIRKITNSLRMIDSSLYHIFYQGISQKIQTKRLLHFIQSYRGKIP